MNAPASKDQLRQQILALVEQYTAISLAPQPFAPGSTVIPAAGKVLGKEEIQNMVEASLDGWLTTGRFNDAFEKKLAELGLSPALIQTRQFSLPAEKAPGQIFKGETVEAMVQKVVGLLRSEAKVL